MVKDRLAEFQEKHVEILIEEAEASGDELTELSTQRFKRNWSGKKFSKKLAINDFLQKTQIIEDNLKCLRRELDEINRLQARLQFSPFKDEEDMQKLHKMGKNLLIRAGKLKVDIEDLPNQTACKKESDMQQRVQRNHIQRLTTMLRDIVIEFQSKQGKCIQKSKDMCRRQREIVCGSAGSEDQLEQLENQQIFTGNYLSEINNARTQLHSIRVRERELRELEGQIVELNELFKTMQLLVTEQGTQLDTIENNVNKSVDYIQIAEKNLGEAVIAKQKYNKRRIVIILIIVTVLAIIGTIIGVALSG